MNCELVMSIVKDYNLLSTGDVDLIVGLIVGGAGGVVVILLIIIGFVICVSCLCFYLIVIIMAFKDKSDYF